MLRQHERPGFEHKDAPAARAVGDEQMFRDDCPKGTAANDDKVEIAPPSGDRLRSTRERFL